MSQQKIMIRRLPLEHRPQVALRQYLRRLLTFITTLSASFIAFIAPLSLWTTVTNRLVFATVVLGLEAIALLLVFLGVWPEATISYLKKRFFSQEEPGDREESDTANSRFASGTYVNAVKALGSLVAEVQSEKGISVTLSGTAAAIQLLNEVIVPWRRKYTEEMARLSRQEKLAEIDIKRAESIERLARAAKERAEAERLQAEVAIMREQAVRVRIEAERTILELQRAKIELALQILSQLSPNLTEVERITYVVKLLPSLDTLTGIASEKTSTEIPAIEQKDEPKDAG